MFIIKVDLEKDFESISWDYLIYVLKHIKLGTNALDEFELV